MSHRKFAVELSRDDGLPPERAEVIADTVDYEEEGVGGGYYVICRLRGEKVGQFNAEIVRGWWLVADDSAND